MYRHVWKRVQAGLAQNARQRGIDRALVSQTVLVLRQVVDLCGPASQSRKMLYRIGCALLEPNPHFFVPVCPAYSHKMGKYTYENISGGLPLLYLKHRPFLLKLMKLVPQARVTILLADHEGDLLELRQSLGVTQEIFRSMVASSEEAIKSDCPSAWNITTFSKQFPGFFEQTLERAGILLSDPALRQRIFIETIGRKLLYQKIGYPIPIQKERTAHVAAQYLCLGENVKAEGGIICNHSTTSLCWYLPSHVAFLHNPVVIY